MGQDIGEKGQSPFQREKVANSECLLFIKYINLDVNVKEHDRFL